ncbi:MAG: fibronectin type III domain-containing protein [Aeromicrobium sp.]
MVSKSSWRLMISAALVVVLSVLTNANAASAATYATPTGLKSTARTSSTVDLTWTAVKNAPRYRIQMATKSDMSGATYYRVTANQRQMTGLKASTKYYFKVRVITADGVNLSPYSGAISVTTSAPPAPPLNLPAPSGLASTDQASKMLSLKWNPVAGAPRYRIQLSTRSDMAGATYFRVTNPRAQIAGLVASTKYYLKVRVITSDGVNMSPYSGAINATTRLSSDPSLVAPFDLTAKAKTTSSIDLAWAAVAGSPKYEVQQSTSSDMSKPVSKRVAPASATVSDLAANTTYHVRVRAVSDTGAALGNFTPTLSVKTAGPATSVPLRVGTFNVKCANCNSHLPEEGTWAERRGTVVSMIVGQAPDVIGIQEASQAWLKDSSGKSIDLSQFEDLRNRLRTAGGNYQLANIHRNNCVKSTTPTNCAPKNQGASKGTKVFFNADTVDLVSQGSKRLELACSGCNERYLAWAILRQKSTGDKFFFADLHLEPGSTYYSERSVQTQQAIAEIRAKNTESLPVIVAGDLNSTRYYTPTNDPYDRMVAYGLVDPLGQTYKSATISSKATAENRIHANYNSYSNFNRAQKYYGANENGSNLDYIFTSPMRTTEWETVVRLDSAGKLSGVIPSDHNMIRATVLLP